MLNDILGLKIIRWDTKKNSFDEVVEIEFTLEDGKKITIQSEIYQELQIHID